MKKIKICLILLIVVFFTESALAQKKNIIKGRIFALPISGVVYSIGIGYERLIINKLSLQVMLNNSGFNQKQYDGPSNVYTTFIPEIKYYFQPLDNISSFFYISSFLEIQKRRMESSGESDDVSIKGNYTNPGILLGKNIRLSYRMHFELYLGIKYRIGSEHKEEIIDSNKIITDKDLKFWDVRSGLNLAYKF